MAFKKLKLNRDKTDFLVIQAKDRLRPPISAIKIAGVRVALTKSAKNIAVIFNDVMNDDHQVQNICKVAFFHIRNSCSLKSGNVLLRKTRNVSSCFCNIKTGQLQFIVGWAASILIR